MGESLFGVLNAGIIAAAGGDALALVGDSFATPAAVLEAIPFCGLLVLGLR